MTFKIKDAAEKAGEIFGALKDIPGLGELLDLVDKAIEAAIKPAIDAISDSIPTVDVPSIGNPLASVPFKKVYDDIQNMVKEQIDKFTNVVNTISSKVSETTQDCPELANLLAGALGISPETLLAERAAAAGSLGAMALVRKCANRKKKCPTSIGSLIDQAMDEKKIASYGNILSGKDDTKKKAGKTSKKQRRKKEEHKKMTGKLGLKGNRMVFSTANMCKISQSKKQNPRKRLLEGEKSLQFMVDVSTAFLKDMPTGTPPKTPLSPVDDPAPEKGFYVQRLVLSEDAKKIDEIECIWNAEVTKTGKVTASKFDPTKRRVDPVENTDFAVRVARAAKFDYADIGMWGMYYLPMSKFKKTEWVANGDASECAGDAKLRCGDHAGCRKKGTKFLTPYKYSTLRQKDGCKIPVTSANEAVSNSNDIIKGMKDPSAALSFRTFAVEVGKVSPTGNGEEKDDATFHVVIGPGKEDEMCDHAKVIIPRAKAAMHIARERVHGTIELIEDLIGGKFDEVPPSLSRMLLVSFGIKLIPNVKGNAKFGSGINGNDAIGKLDDDGVLIIDDTHMNVFETVRSQEELKTILLPLKRKYELIQQYLVDKFSKGTVIRHQSRMFGDGYRKTVEGLARAGSYVDNGSIFVRMRNFEQEEQLDETIIIYNIANSIIHETSHAVALTDDYFYSTNNFGSFAGKIGLYKAAMHLTMASITEQRETTVLKKMNAAKFKRGPEAVGQLFIDSKCTPAKLGLKPGEITYDSICELDGWDTNCVNVCAPLKAKFAYDIQRTAFAFDLALRYAKLKDGDIKKSLTGSSYLPQYSRAEITDNADSLASFAVMEPRLFGNEKELSEKLREKGSFYYFYTDLFSGDDNKRSSAVRTARKDG